MTVTVIVFFVTAITATNEIVSREEGKSMNKEQEQRIVDYYSTTDKYICSDRHSDRNQTVYTKENGRYQWLVLEQKSQSQVEVRQTDRHGTITARQSKAETCANLSAILPQIKDSDTKQIINSALKKLNALSEETCAELNATTKRRKITERDHSIKARLVKAKEQSKQPTVSEGKRHRNHSKGDMEL